MFHRGPNPKFEDFEDLPPLYFPGSGFEDFEDFEPAPNLQNQISKSSKLPEGPAKEERWRRVLRTTGKNLFIMRWCAVKQ